MTRSLERSTHTDEVSLYPFIELTETMSDHKWMIVRDQFHPCVSISNFPSCTYKLLKYCNYHSKKQSKRRYLLLITDGRIRDTV